MSERTGKCRHCAALLTEFPAGGVWEDADGFVVCIKLPLTEIIGRGDNPADYVFHEPMPEGFRGAPEGKRT